MGVSTYMKYMGCAAALLVFTATAGWAQQQTATTKASEAQTSDWSNDTFDSAALQAEMAQAKAELKAEAAEMQARAQQVKAEVAREMAEEGVNRQEMANLAARLETERAGLEEQARSAAQQAQQLFTQTPGVVLNDEDTGWLGLEMTEVTPEKAKGLKISPVHGVLVSEVLPDSPAAKAGLEANDVILEYDGHEVEGTVQFRRLVRETPPGRNVNIAVMRSGQERQLTIQVGSASEHTNVEIERMMPMRNFNFKFNMPDVLELSEGTPVLGIEAEDVSGQLGEYFDVPGDAGVLVREVSLGTPAARAGLKAGDVITRVDGVKVKTVDELREELRQKRDEKTMPLTVIRHGSQMTITVTLEQRPSSDLARVRSAVL